MAERRDGSCRQRVEGDPALRGVVHEHAPVPKHDASLRPDVALRRQVGELVPHVLGRAERGMGRPHTGAVPAPVSKGTASVSSRVMPTSSAARPRSSATTWRPTE